MQVKAARLIKHGEPLQVEATELAEPGPGEAIVELAYAGVNPVDTYMAQGLVAPDGPVPRTLGGEGAGTTGGRRVVVHGAGLGAVRDGLWAQRAVVPEAAMIDVPDGVDLRDAAAIGVAGVTAWRCVTELAKVGAEDTVVVLGAAGGVGSLIMSLARSAGASVIGQTGNEQRRDWLIGHGADHVVTGDAGGLADQLAPYRPTVVFDPLGGAFTGQAVEALEPHGRLVLFGTSAGLTGELPLRPLYRKGIHLLGFGGLSEPHEAQAAACRAALEAVAAGQLTVPVDSTLPLDSVNEAFDRIARRQVLGKLVLDTSA